MRALRRCKWPSKRSERRHARWPDGGVGWPGGAGRHIAGHSGGRFRRRARAKWRGQDHAVPDAARPDPAQRWWRSGRAGSGRVHAAGSDAGCRRPAAHPRVPGQRPRWNPLGPAAHNPGRPARDRSRVGAGGRGRPCGSPDRQPVGGRASARTDRPGADRYPATTSAGRTATEPRSTAAGRDHRPGSHAAPYVKYYGPVQCA